MFVFWKETEHELEKKVSENFQIARGKLWLFVGCWVEILKYPVFRQLYGYLCQNPCWVRKVNAPRLKTIEQPLLVHVYARAQVNMRRELLYQHYTSFQSFHCMQHTNLRSRMLRPPAFTTVLENSNLNFMIVMMNTLFQRSVYAQLMACFHCVHGEK